MNFPKITIVCILSLACAATVQAADAKIEFRLAETKKAEGLVEAKIAGTEKKIYLPRKAVLVNADIAAARVVKNGDAYNLELDLTAAGARKLEQATASHLGKPLAVLFNGEVVCAPVIREKISKKAVVTGNFTKAQLDQIASGLK